MSIKAPPRIAHTTGSITCPWPCSDHVKSTYWSQSP